VFFRENGTMPAVLKFEVSPLPLRGGLNRREILETLGKRVADAEGRLREEARRGNKKYLGKRRASSQKPTDTPRSKSGRRELSPRIAGRDKWRRIEVLERLKSFYDEYKVALAKWIGGKRRTLFPAGVYKMRVQFRALCVEV